MNNDQRYTYKNPCIKTSRQDYLDKNAFYFAYALFWRNRGIAKEEHRTNNRTLSKFYKLLTPEEQKDFMKKINKYAGLKYELPVLIRLNGQDSEQGYHSFFFSPIPRFIIEGNNLLLSESNRWGIDDPKKIECVENIDDKYKIFIFYFDGKIRDNSRVTLILFTESQALYSYGWKTYINQREADDFIDFCMAGGTFEIAKEFNKWQEEDARMERISFDYEYVEYEESDDEVEEREYRENAFAELRHYGFEPDENTLTYDEHRQWASLNGFEIEETTLKVKEPRTQKSQHKDVDADFLKKHKYKDDGADLPF